MHFVIGGANNGKREWVRNILTIDGISEEDIQFKKSVIGNNPSSSVRAIIWTEIEEWIKEKCIQGVAETKILGQWEREMSNLAHWEQGNNYRQVFLIATDQSKGIVPIDPIKRMVRDISGWCHQLTAQKSSRVTRIWYGLAEELKIEGDQP